MSGSARRKCRSLSVEQDCSGELPGCQSVATSTTGLGEDDALTGVISPGKAAPTMTEGTAPPSGRDYTERGRGRVPR